jgi:general secretion pathway protein H
MTLFPTGLTTLQAATEKIKILKNNRPVTPWEKPLSTSRDQTGFTLVELTIVLFLMTLMLGVVGTNFYQIWQREQVRMSLRQVTGILRQGRSEAVSGNKQVQIYFDLENGGYWLHDAPAERRQLPAVEAEKAELVWQSQERRLGHISFNGDGSSSGGRVTFVGPGKVPFTVVVDRITGQIHAGSR